MENHEISIVLVEHAGGLISNDIVVFMNGFVLLHQGVLVTLDRLFGIIVRASHITIYNLNLDEFIKYNYDQTLAALAESDQFDQGTDL